MKTPEEMAEEYLDQDKVACDAINHAAEDLVKDAFLAGYKAAMEQLADEIAVIRESWSATKVNELIHENAKLTIKINTIKNKQNDM